MRDPVRTGGPSVNSICAKLVVVRDQALDPVDGYHDGLRAALPAIEYGLGDEVAWRLLVDCMMGDNEAEGAISRAVRLHGRLLDNVEGQFRDGR